MYALAHKFDIDALMDMTMSTYLRYLKTKNRIPGPSEIGFAYDLNLPSGSPMRKLRSWPMHYILCAVHQPNAKEIWPTDLLAARMTGDLTIDVFTRIRNHAPTVGVYDVRNGLLCEFHVHASNENCPDKGCRA